MEYIPIMSYTSLKEGVFDTLTEEHVNGDVKKYSMKTYQNLNELTHMMMSEIDSISYNNCGYSVNFEEKFILMCILKTPDVFRYVKIEGVTGEIKKRIKQNMLNITNGSKKENIDDFFSDKTYVAPRYFSKNNSCTIV